MSDEKPFSLEEATIDELHEAIKAGRTTCVAVVHQYIERARAYNGVCSVLVTEEGAPVPEAAGTVRAGAPLRLAVRDQGSGVDPLSLLARIDGRYRRVRYRLSTGRVEVSTGTLAHGRHTLVFTVADYQETKNTEDASATLPNTRRLSARFSVR